MYKNLVEQIVSALWQQHRRTLSEKIKLYEKIREKIEKNDPSVEEYIFTDAVTSIYTAGFSSETAEKYSGKLVKRFGLNLGMIIELGEEGLAKEIGMGEKKNRKVVKLCKHIINSNESTPFCHWVKRLDRGENVFSLGPKSDEDFLKCLGYFTHFPVDTLTARFFERVGLLRYGTVRYDTFINPLGTDRYERLRELMKRVYLEASEKTLTINGKDYRLEDNLGIIDILVWLHCNENKKYEMDSVCRGRDPMCEECHLNSACEFWKQRAPKPEDSDL